MAVVVPYNASFVDEGHPRISVTSDVIVEALFIIGTKFSIMVTKCWWSVMHVIDQNNIVSCYYHKNLVLN